MVVEVKTIYAIRQKDTGKIYIGSSRMVAERLKSHLAALESGRHSNEDMQADYNKYGRESFEFYEIDKMPTEAYRQRETYWMFVFNSCDRNKGYNYKDWGGRIRESITEFPRINLEDYTPVKKRDLVYCFKKTADYLGITMDELMGYKQEG